MEPQDLTQALFNDLKKCIESGFKRRDDLKNFQHYDTRLTLMREDGRFQVTLQLIYDRQVVAGLSQTIDSPADRAGFTPYMIARQILDDLAALAAQYDDNFNQEELNDYDE